MTEEKVEEKEKVFELVNVPTQHTLAVQTPEGEIISTDQAVVEVLNTVKRLEKAIAG